MKRREFLKKTGGGAFGLALPNMITSNALGANGVPPASERIVMAGLAIGGRGKAVMGEFLSFKEIQVVAVNNVRKSHLRSAQNQVNQKYGNRVCKAYTKQLSIMVI